MVAAVGSRRKAHVSEPKEKGHTMRSNSIGRGGVLYASCALLLTVYFYRCSIRVYQWSNRERLFAADVASFPRSTKTQHQYATVLHRMGRFDEALVHFKSAHSIFKDSALTEYCIAQIYIETGRPQEALVHFESIIGGYGLGFGHFNLYALY